MEPLARTGLRPGQGLWLRWMIRRDMREVLDIEAESFEEPWPEEEFIGHLRQRNCIGMVAVRSDRVVAYMVYALDARHLHLHHFAVASEFRLQGIGTQMIAKLKAKLSTQRRRRIVCEISERNVAAQVFFRAMGFRSVRTLRGYYWLRNPANRDDAYQFAFDVVRDGGTGLADLEDRCEGMGGCGPTMQDAQPRRDR